MTVAPLHGNSDAKDTKSFETRKMMCSKRSAVELSELLTPDNLKTIVLVWFREFAPKNSSMELAVI